MKIQSLSVLLLLVGFELHAQYIEGRINLYAGYSIGACLGESLINEDDFITPALYPNFRGMNGWMIKGLAGWNEYFRIGAGFDHVKALRWKYPDETDYEGSQVVMNGYSLIAQFRTRIARTGFLNHVSVIAELAPVIGTARLTLIHPLFSIENNDDPAEQPMESSDLFVGGKGSAGFEFSLSGSLGFYLSYSFSYLQVDSKLYHDDRIVDSQLNAGFFARLLKNKRFYY